MAISTWVHVSCKPLFLLLACCCYQQCLRMHMHLGAL